MLQNPTEEVEARLKSSKAADAVRDLQIRVRVAHRAARLIFLPSYFITYRHGTMYDEKTNKIVPETYGALIGGLRGAGVSAERHYCSKKAQVAALSAAGGISVALSGIPSLFGGATVSEGVAQGVAGLLSLETAFLGLVVGGAASLAARAGLKVARDREDERFQRLDEDDYRASMHSSLRCYKMWM